jgi:putative transposase
VAKKAFKFRLWTNANQERELSVMLESQRRLYNAALGQRKDSWETLRVNVKYTEQSAWYKAQRRENPWFGRINFSSAQATLRRLDKAFANFFRRVKAGDKPGYPRFKGADRFDSIEFPSHGDGIRLAGNRLRVQHVGTVRVCLHRPVEGTIKTLTLKREADKWFVVVVCEVPDRPVIGNINPPVGLDVGLEHFLTTSDGEHLANPRFLKTELPALRRAGRSVSRKKLRGANRKKTVKLLRRKHARIANLRREHAHKISNCLFERYGLIAVERLNVHGMLRNRRLARAIADAGWSQFISTLKSKAARAGARVIQVNPSGTSQECSSCGALVPKALSVRIHRCLCGLVLDRDVNAARNILRRALAQLGTSWLSANPALAGLLKEAVCFS